MGVLRLLLALSVVLGHLGAGYSLAGGLVAVQLFFIVSGFYMETVLSGKYDPRRDLGLFYISRALRIYSVYFACLAVSLVVFAALALRGEGLLAYISANADRLDTPAKAWLVLTTFGLLGQDVVLFQKIDAGHLVFNTGGNFGPDPEGALAWKFMAIPQAWTISLELMFYALAPFLTRLSTRALVLIVAASLSARGAVYAAGFAGDPWIYRFFPFELALFVCGMLARRFHDAFISRIAGDMRRTIGWGFIAACCLVQTTAHALGVPIILAVWPLYAAALVALPCLFAGSLFPGASTWDARLAELSYPVYLIHWIVIVAYGAVASTMPGWLQIPACVTGALAAGWAIAVMVERPVDRVRHALRGRDGLRPVFSARKPSHAVDAFAGGTLRPAAVLAPGPRPPERPRLGAL